MSRWHLFFCSCTCVKVLFTDTFLKCRFRWKVEIIFRLCLFFLKPIIFVYSYKQSESLQHDLFTVHNMSEMAAYFNLNNNEISKNLLVNKFNMILDNQGRAMLNDQKNPFAKWTMEIYLLVCSEAATWGVLKKFTNFTRKQLVGISFQ